MAEARPAGALHVAEQLRQPPAAGLVGFQYRFGSGGHPLDVFLGLADILPVHGGVAHAGSPSRSIRRRYGRGLLLAQPAGWAMCRGLWAESKRARILSGPFGGCFCR